MLPMKSELKRSHNNFSPVEDIDQIVSDLAGGRFVEPSPVLPKHNLRALMEYSKKKGVKPYQLTQSERDQFLVK